MYIIWEKKKYIKTCEKYPRELKSSTIVFFPYYSYFEKDFPGYFPPKKKSSDRTHLAHSH